MAPRRDSLLWVAILFFLGSDIVFDLHHDLLSICYLSSKYQSFDYLEKMKKAIRKDNIVGVFCNFYFMNSEEMEEEFRLKKEDIDVLTLFRESKTMYDASFSCPSLYSIEGCDYIKGEEELEQLYEAGLDAFLLVWNNPNRYGSGNRSDYGLTEKGKRFLRKGIALGMGIDLSHANQKTFFDMIEVIKEEQQKGKEVICYASHSNSYELCPHPRNLTKDELLALKEVGGMIGLVSYPLFVGDSSRSSYVEHIKYMVDLFGSDRVMVSSDNMNFVSIVDPEDQEEHGIYNYNTIQKELKEDLLNVFSEEDTEKILVHNAKKLYDRIKERRRNVRY